MEPTDRDRDSTGRARNARPRDALGRPLPYGAAGIARQPEGVSRTATETVDVAQRLFDEGRPFHAHEVFEDAWKAGCGTADGALWKALAQLAVGCTHLLRGNEVGAGRLLDRAVAALAPVAGTAPHDLDIDGLRTWARNYKDHPMPRLRCEPVSEAGAILSVMPWSPDVAFLTGLDFFDDIVGSVDARGWRLPSPCIGWAAVDVLGHIGIATDFGTKLLRGEQPEWHPPLGPPGLAVIGDPTQWWSAKIEPAKDAIRGVDLAMEVDSPKGKRPIGEGLSFPAVDLFVHGWDLARSTDRDVEIPGEAIEFAHRALDQVPAEQMRSPSVFGAQVELPAGASASQRFIAWTGRDPRPLSS